MIHHHNDGKTYSKNIYGFCFEGGLGDWWCWTNKILHLSELNKETILVTTQNSSSVKAPTGNLKMCANFLENSGSFEYREARETIKLIYNFFPPDRNIPEGYDCFHPAIYRWSDKKSKIIAYQFDGIHLAEQKNPNNDEINYFLNTTKNLGYTPVDIGHRQPLDFCIKTMAESHCFVGCPSGMGVIARSVGVPINLIYKNINLSYVEFMQHNYYKIDNLNQNIKWYRAFDDFFDHCDLNRTKRIKVI